MFNFYAGVPLTVNDHFGFICALLVQDYINIWQNYIFFRNSLLQFTIICLYHNIFYPFANELVIFSHQTECSFVFSRALHYICILEKLHPKRKLWK